jgi:tRNA(Ile)-lysidine synthase
MYDIFDKFYKNVTEHNLIKPKENIVAGISGGIDSVVLLDLLVRLRAIFDYNLYVAHVNHGVRGIEADRDEKFVERLSNKYSVPFYSTKVDMDGFAKEKKISSEEAGRILRYGFFRNILNEVGGGKIAVAHNKNDQAETVMLRIIRGTGIDGLKGMQFKAQDIIRPILNIKRNELHEYLMTYGLEHVEDYTNVETIYQRNRVRLELFPYIEEKFNPNIVDSLYRLSKNSQIDSDALDDIAEKKYNLLVKKTDNNSIIIEGALFNKELPAIKNRIIRKAIFCLCDDIVDIEQKHVELIIELLENNKTGKSIDMEIYI